MRRFCNDRKNRQVAVANGREHLVTTYRLCLPCPQAGNDHGHTHQNKQHEHDKPELLHSSSRKCTAVWAGAPSTEATWGQPPSAVRSSAARHLETCPASIFAEQPT